MSKGIAVWNSVGAFGGQKCNNTVIATRSQNWPGIWTDGLQLMKCFNKREIGMYCTLNLIYSVDDAIMVTIAFWVGLYVNNDDQDGNSKACSGQNFTYSPFTNKNNTKLHIST